MNQRPRIIVTGVAGFIGSNLADRLLAEGYSVVGIDDLSSGIREQVPDGVDFHQVDIRSPGLASYFKAGDIIYHLGAKTSVNDCQKDPLDAASVNVVGTVNVFEAALRARAEKVIYAETSALYEGTSVLPTPETEVCPQSFYAVSKLASKFFADAYQRFHGLRMTALRYFNVYGPRQDYRRSIPPLMCAIIMNLLRGQPPTIYGSGEKRRDFIYVDDVNAFHLLCMKDPRTDGRVFNLGSGTNYSVQDIFNAIEAILKTGIQPRHESDLPGEAQVTLADISEAKSLEWKPQVTLDEGLRRSIDYLSRYVMTDGS